jgi:hypothetical protein
MVLTGAALAPDNVLGQREDFADPGHNLPQGPSLSVAHVPDSESLLSDLATLEYGTELTSVVAALAACDSVAVSICDTRANGALEAGIALIPLGAEKSLTLLGLGLEAGLIELAFAQSAPNEETGVQSQGSQDDIGLVRASIKTDGGRSSNARVGIASDGANIGVNARNTPRLQVPVSGDFAGSRLLSMPTLTLDDKRAHESVGGYGIGYARIAFKPLEEAMVVQSDSFESAKVIPSHDPVKSLPVAELYEAGAPVSYDIGDTLPLAGSLIPLGAQVSAETGPELMSNADATGRAGGFSLDASATAGFETNPFLIDLPDTATASLRLSLLPTFSRQGARGDVRVSARFEQIVYTGNYDAVQNVGADLRSRFMLNERLEGNVDLSFDSGVFVTNLTGLGAVDGSPDDIGVLPGGDDITLLGLDQRRTQYQAGGGLRYQLSERDELDVSMSFRADRFGRQDSPGLLESDFLTGQMSYARQISSGLTIGVAVDASSIDFVEQSLGGISTISPQATVVLAFSPTWELTGSLGVTSIRSDTDFSEETSTAFSGDFSICRSGVRATLCLTGARQVLPFGIGGGGLQSNAGASYSLRLSERETVSLSASYGKASEAFLAEGSGIETVSAFLGYQLELAERVRLSADARYTDLRVGLGPNVSNFQALVGVIVSMGRAR